MAAQNIVLICLDTVRKDCFDRVARRLTTRADISIADCRATSSWTIPSHASMLTGRLPHQHGIHSYRMDFSSMKRADTFLAGLPHRAIGVSANPYASPRFGFEEPFDEFISVTPSVPYSDGLYLSEFGSDTEGILKVVEYAGQALRHDYPLKSLVNGVSHVIKGFKPNWIPRSDDDGGRAVVGEATEMARQSTEPFFMFINLMEAHGPFRPTTLYDSTCYSCDRGWSSESIDIWAHNSEATNESATPKQITHYRELYSAAIEYLDRLIDSFIDDLLSLTSEETTVIITADHGENLGYPWEDGLLEHKGSLSEGVLHVPLILVNPPDGFSVDSDDLFSHLHLGRLIESVASGAPFLASNDECVRVELLGSGPANPDSPGDSAHLYERAKRGVYAEGDKFLWDSNGKYARYAVRPEQPCHQDLLFDGTIDELPNWMPHLFDDDITDYSEAADMASQSDIDDSTKDRLLDLGYM